MSPAAETMMQRSRDVTAALMHDGLTAAHLQTFQNLLWSPAGRYAIVAYAYSSPPAVRNRILSAFSAVAHELPRESATEIAAALVRRFVVRPGEPHSELAISKLAARAVGGWTPGLDGYSSANRETLLRAGIDFDPRQAICSFAMPRGGDPALR
jgi:hypothetical protein